MIIENGVFQEHCQMWHHQYTADNHYQLPPTIPIVPIPIPNPHPVPIPYSTPYPARPLPAQIYSRGHHGYGHNQGYGGQGRGSGYGQGHNGGPGPGPGQGQSHGNDQNHRPGSQHRDDQVEIRSENQFFTPQHQRPPHQNHRVAMSTENRYRNSNYNYSSGGCTTPSGPPSGPPPATSSIGYRSNRNSVSFSSNDRSKSFNNSFGGGYFPPRKTLIDSFVDRNDDYWKNRVTLKIDVAFTDHSHVIGKQGRNTQCVMKETGCHIHFPDANRDPNLEKSNMVSIAGPMTTVDKARRAIRDLAPLVITLEMKGFVDDAAVLSDDPLVQELSIMDSLSILVRTNRSSGMPFFVIRGSVNQIHAVHNATLKIQQKFMNTNKATVSTSLDVLKPQQPIVCGTDGANINVISQRTGATIHYPKMDAGQATTFFIQGTVDAVLSARQHIVGCLPMSFAFEIEKEVVDTDMMGRLQKEYDLSINLRPARCGESHMIIVKGPERLKNSMYAVRARLLCTAMPEKESLADDFDFMKDFNVPAYLPFTGYDNSPTGTPQAVVTMRSPFAVMPFSPLPTPSPFQYFSNNEASYFNYELVDSAASYRRGTSTNATGNGVGSSVSDSESGSSIVNSVISPLDSEMVVPKMIRFDPVPEEAPLASGLLEAAKKIQETAHIWKAPGAERSNSSSDYEAQQVLATKAMLEKPNGPRVPTDQWSGLGFSRSMPTGVKNANGTVTEVQTTRKMEPDLETLEEEIEDDKIGPWAIVEATANLGKKSKIFNSTTFFDCGTITLTEEDLEEADNISILLSKLNLAKYVDIFREQEVDLSTLLTMTDSDLRELGVNTFGARRKLLVVISGLKERRDRGQ